MDSAADIEDVQRRHIGRAGVGIGLAEGALWDCWPRRKMASAVSVTDGSLGFRCCTL